MVDFKKLADKAKAAVEDAGGTDALKQKAEELKVIATGDGSLADKAKEAAEVVQADPAGVSDATETAPAAPAAPAADSASSSDQQ